MNRHELDAFSARHRLGADAAANALILTGNRPDKQAWRDFAALVLRASGLGATGAGIIFFVAANWQDYGVMGRFALLEGALLLSIATAIWRTPAQTTGQGALVLAALLTGALLALFGMSYQTGADTYELFFTWALLTLPFALAALSGALWAVWWAILNAGLALLFGWLAPQRLFWRFVMGWDIDMATLLLAPCAINLLAAAAILQIRRTRFKHAAPLWLSKFLASIGIAYGTVATLMVVTRSIWRVDEPELTSQGAFVALAYAAVSVAIGVATWKRQRDVFPMALLAASWIAISTGWLVYFMRFDGIGAFFLVAIWLIGTSTVTGTLLMRWLRIWRPAATASLKGAAA